MGNAPLFSSAINSETTHATGHSSYSPSPRTYSILKCRLCCESFNTSDCYYNSLACQPEANANQYHVGSCTRLWLRSAAALAVKSLFLPTRTARGCHPPGTVRVLDSLLSFFSIQTTKDKASTASKQRRTEFASRCSSRAALSYQRQRGTLAAATSF